MTLSEVCYWISEAFCSYTSNNLPTGETDTVVCLPSLGDEPQYAAFEEVCSIEVYAQTPSPTGALPALTLQREK